MLDNIGSIAVHILTIFPDVTAGISGTMLNTVDNARQDVANYTGYTIPTSNIDPKFVPAIVDFAIADAIDEMMAQQGGEDIRLAELTVNESGDPLSSQFYRERAEKRLERIGRRVNYAKSLS